MLPLIAGYDYDPALISLPPRVPRYSRDEEKLRNIATIPAGFLIPKLGSIRGKIPNKSIT